MRRTDPHNLPRGGGREQQGGACPRLPLSQAWRPRGRPCSPGRARWTCSFCSSTVRPRHTRPRGAPGPRPKPVQRGLGVGPWGGRAGPGPRVREAEVCPQGGLGWPAPAGAECPGEAQQPGGARQSAFAEVKDPPQSRSFSNSYTAGGPLTERGAGSGALSCPHPAQASPHFAA